MAEPSSPKCSLCNKGCDTAPLVNVGKTGLNTLIRVSKERDLTELHNYFTEMESLNPIGKVVVHHDCRRKFTDARKRSLDEVPKKKLRPSLEERFDWKLHCFLCEQRADKRYLSVCNVSTLPIRETLINRCKQRNDEWGKVVLGKLESCNDLVAEEAVYHSSCMAQFRLYVNQENERGRPENTVMLKVFSSACEWLENVADGELYTLKEFLGKMRELNNGEDVTYSIRTVKKKLQEYYGRHIFFCELPGRADVICFKDMASYIINEMKQKSVETKEDIVIAAAKIIKAEIRDMPPNIDRYPSVTDLQSTEYAKQCVPGTLKLLLDYLINPELKKLSIGQCITQASRPRSIIAPILFGMGVDLDKSFSSKWLTDHLSRFGFSITSDEVLRFKESAIESFETYQSENILPTFTQWVADNVDHNIATLTGKGTFHGMGVISCSSLTTSHTQAIKRLKERQKTSSFVEHRGIEIIPYSGSSYNGLLKLKLKPFMQLLSPHTLPSELGYDLLWQSAWFFSSKTQPRPNWSGFMQEVTNKMSTPDKSAITFLPIIDLNPSDETCIYSTLCFVIEQAKKLQIQTPTITFDQPLWLKAMGIKKEQNMDIVIRLGGFHTMMSFLGSIGTLMSGSGIEELFAEVYAENSVVHMMSGKAVSRALRGHFLVESALTNIIVETLIAGKKLDVTPFRPVYEQAMKGELSGDQFLAFSESSEFRSVLNVLNDEMLFLKGKSRTAKLWLQYIEYIGILKQYILAERTSNWFLHIQSMKNMLNLFAASGHIHYARSARIYIQEMEEIKTTNPWLQEQFERGFHAVRRSGRHWSGLWSDLVIEQTLMRSIKSRGGLTRGRGMTETVRHLWVLSLSHSAAVHDAMSELSGLAIKSSEQHIEMGSSRRSRDFDDGCKFEEWLKKRNPFTYDDAHLHSLTSGLVSVSGQDLVNCENAETIGKTIHESLDDLSIPEAKIKRRDHIRPLDSLYNTIKVGKEKPMYINPTVLFTRLAAIAQREENVEQYFEHEMTTTPMALFKNNLMRKPDKASLRKTLLDKDQIYLKDSDQCKPDFNNCIFSVDGGALLNRVRFNKGMKFREVAMLYVSYVRTHYRSSYIVFDGYETATTKSSEHARRQEGKKAQAVIIAEDNEVPYSQAQLLANEGNKTQLIRLISKYLADDGQTVYQCKGDADTKIVSTSLQLANDKDVPIVVVADDTDIAVMLLYHWNKEMQEIFFHQEKGKKTWSIKNAVSAIAFMKEHLLFVHAWSGCDTTSSTFGKGKSTFMNMVKKANELQSASKILNDPYSTQGEVGNAAIKTFKVVYGGNVNDTLTIMRYHKYLDMVCKGLLEPEKMPPMERSAYYHGLRVHLQIIEWKVLDENRNLKIEEWGWKMENGIYSPITTDKAVAPDNLLKVIRCKCKAKSKKQCGTNSCTCHKHGINCMSTCGECRRKECLNAEKYTICPTDDDNDEGDKDVVDNLMEVL